MNPLIKNISRKELKAVENEIEDFVKLLKRSNAEASFHGFQQLKESELLRVQWDTNRLKAEKLIQAFRTVSDQWSRSEAMQWQLEARAVREALEKVNRLTWSFLDQSPFDVFE